MFKDWIKKNRYKHFLSTLLISITLFFIFMRMDLLPSTLEIKICMGFVSAFLASLINLGREWYFAHKSIKKDKVSNYDKFDVYWGTIGAVLGSIIMIIFY